MKKSCRKPGKINQGPNRLIHWEPKNSLDKKIETGPEGRFQSGFSYC